MIGPEIFNGNTVLVSLVAGIIIASALIWIDEENKSRY